MAAFRGRPAVATSKGSHILVMEANFSPRLESYSVLGAPNDLLSVSAILQQGLSFHFIKEKSWILTPEMETLDLIEKGGLIWLKWQKSIDPSTQHANYEKKLC
jgi:hypothetical protein